MSNLLVWILSGEGRPQGAYISLVLGLCLPGLIWEVTRGGGGGEDFLLSPISDLINEEATGRWEVVRNRYQNQDLLSPGLTPHS